MTALQISRNMMQTETAGSMKMIRSLISFLIWAKDENGKDELYTLKEAGVGAICLQRAATDFSLNSQKDNTQNGQIRSTGIFLYENGNTGTMQQLDLAQ